VKSVIADSQDAVKMGKSDSIIYVVEREKLFEEDKEFQGFKSKEEFDYEERILDNILTMRRGSTEEPKDHPNGNAELDTRYKQPIGYMMVVNTSTKEVYTFQRASDDKKYSDRRLQGKWSWGVGGHIEPIDSMNGSKNPLIESRLRELQEEIIIEGEIQNVFPLGYINDDRDSIGSVHIGILYLIEINGSASKRDDEMQQGIMLSVDKLEELCNAQNVVVESWSRIALEPLKKYFYSI